MEGLFMPNKTLAIEWLIKAYHDLSSAQILYNAHHFTDTIGYDLQQAIEKTLKTFIAYENKKIMKTHELVDIYNLVGDYIHLDDSQVKLLAVATDYYAEDKYPSLHYILPQRQEIKQVLDFATDLFEQVCQILNIESKEVKR